MKKLHITNLFLTYHIWFIALWRTYFLENMMTKLGDLPPPWGNKGSKQIKEFRKKHNSLNIFDHWCIIFFWRWLGDLLASVAGRVQSGQGEWCPVSSLCHEFLQLMQENTMKTNVIYNMDKYMFNICTNTLCFQSGHGEWCPVSPVWLPAWLRANLHRVERIDGGGEGWRGIEGWPLQQKGTQMSLVGWELENTMQRRVLDSL